MSTAYIDQRTPFSEESFLQCQDAELMAMVAESITCDWAVKAMLAQRKFDEERSHAAKLEYANRDGWNEGAFWLEISPESYHYWAQRLGRDCWSDPQFRRDYARDNPASVRWNKTGRTMITAGFDLRKAA